jgi:CRISPR-associated endonuclease/helicase Cas3
METLGEVIILNFNEERLASLPEIKIAQEKTERILREFSAAPDAFDHDLIGLKAIERYYQLYFYDRACDMDYPIDGDSLLSRLSTNALAVREYERINNASPPFFLRQSFANAGRSFEIIDAPTEGVIVPYNQEARDIIGSLCGEQWVLTVTRNLLKRAQRYSVNIFASDKAKLISQNAILETHHKSEIYYLKDQYYTKTYGITMDGTGSLAFLSI